MRYYLTTLVFLSTLLGYTYYQQYSVCYTPISYEIQNFSEKFNISKDKFISTAKEAEAIWEKGVGKNLFEYKPGGQLKINLIFDDRQASTIAANESKEVIEESRSSYDKLLAQYEVKELLYQSELRFYEARVKGFELRLDAYNDQVTAANRGGGATQAEFERLEKERISLENLKSGIDQDRIELNQKAADLNTLGNQVNELAQKLNITVDIHNERFGEAREFDQGEYTHNKINIYQFEAVSDLRLVLAHEFGHALNLEHIENPKSIMYYLMDKQDLNNPSLTTEDKDSFKYRCELHIPKLQELFNRATP